MFYRPHRTPPLPPLAFAGLVALAGAGTAAGDVVINEVHYDPAPKTEAVEFVELYNSGGQAVDVGGWRFTDGFAYTFAPGASIGAGGYLVLAQNREDYNRKWGSVLVGGMAAHGEFESGTLANGGERITLVDAAGAEVDTVGYGEGFPWPLDSRGQGESMELVNPSLDNDLGGSWRASDGGPTPGEENSVFAAPTAVPPQVRQVGHEPREPRGNEAVVVSAKVTDPDGVASATLHYQQVRPGNYIRLTDAAYEREWVELPMNDAGTGGDAAAGDDVFTATVPPSVNAHRHLVRYRITVEDMEGNDLRVPYADDPQPNFAYFCYNGVPAWSGSLRPGSAPSVTYPSSSLDKVAVYHLLADATDVRNCQYNSSFNGRQFRGTLVYEGEVYDHFEYRNRGRASTYQVGKNKWKWNFFRGHRLKARDNYGRRYGVDWDKVNVLPGSNPWWGNNVSTDGTVLFEPVAFRLYELAGTPSSHTHYFHLRIIDGAQEANGTDQYEGDFWGLYIAVEQPDGQFLDDRGLPDGNIFNLHGSAGGSPQRNQGATQPTNKSDLSDFQNRTNGGNQTEQWYRDNLDFDSYFAWNGINLACNNADLRPNENVNYYHSPEPDKWYILPWDLDLTFERAPHLGRGDTPAWENIHRLFRHEAIEIEYQNRVRHLLNLLVNAEQAALLVDEYARFIFNETPSSAVVPVVSLGKSSPAEALAVTAVPHGYMSGETVIVQGAEVAVYNGEQEITVLSETEFTFRVSILAPGSTGGEISTFKADGGAGPSFTEANQAMWDYHPDKRKVGIWYKNINGISSEDFPGLVRYMKDFMSPGGYGHNLLSTKLAPGGDIPNPPAVTYTGPAGFPVNGLTFSSTAFSGGSILAPQEFAAMEWRLAEVTDRASPAFDPAEPRKYEIEADWVSGELTTFTPGMKLPLTATRVDRTYRVRARMKNDGGYWSDWSEPVQFVPGEPDLSALRQHLLITEVMYHPADKTPEEEAAGFSNSDFEFIELFNASTGPLDLGGLRFTKGVDFDFPEEAGQLMLTDGAYGLLVRNRAAFDFRYGDDLPVLGEYGGFGADDRLGNDGERLKLSFGAGIPVVEFVYDDGPPWPDDAPGGGFSIVLVDPAARPDPTLPESWRLSTDRGGSPGARDPDPPAGGGYEDWLGDHFDPAERDDPAVSGQGADPDGDGVANVFEFVFGGDPRTGEAGMQARLPQTAFQTIEVGGRTARYLTLQFLERPAAGVEFTVEVSTDLLTWESGSDHTSPVDEPVDNGDGTRTVTVRTRFPNGRRPFSFFRLRVGTGP